MRPHTYDKKLNGELHMCEECNITPVDPDTGKGTAIQHHIGGRSYMNEAIWLCSDCHAKVHNPTAYGLPKDWAYEQGYLLKKTLMKKTKKKRKACTHSCSYFDVRLGYIKCQFCGKKMDEVRTGKKKKRAKEVDRTTKEVLAEIDLLEGVSEG